MLTIISDGSGNVTPRRSGEEGVACRKPGYAALQSPGSSPTPPRRTAAVLKILINYLGTRSVLDLVAAMVP